MTDELEWNHKSRREMEEWMCSVKIKCCPSLQLLEAHLKKAKQLQFNVKLKYV